MEAWLLKPAYSYLQGKQAGFQEDEKICQPTWNKWMMIIFPHNLFYFVSLHLQQ